MIRKARDEVSRAEECAFAAVWINALEQSFAVDM